MAQPNGSRNKITIRQIVADFIRPYQDQPEIFGNNAKLARMIKADKKIGHHFSDVEHARIIVRDLKGAAGKRRRDKLDTERYQIGQQFESIVKDFKSHEAKTYDPAPFKVKGKDVLILSDLQYPYLCAKSLEAALRYSKQNYNPDVVLINGDWFDFYQGSEFMKDPRLMRIAQELDGGCDLLRKVQDIFGVPIVFKYGNHCERFDNYITKKAGELKGVPEFELEYCIRKRVPDGITIVKDKRTIQVGKLNVIHGHEYSSGVFNPVNPARGLWNRAMCSVLQGHNHQPSSHYEKNLEGKIFVTYSTGCLCDLKPLFMPNNKWLNGFARVEVQENGDFIVHNKIIKDGKVY